MPDPAYDARELLRVFGGVSAESMILGDPDIAPTPKLRQAVDRRLAREPLQYITGQVGFYREEYRVTPAALIPRQDTELLVDYAVHRLPRGGYFADLCCGCGCIALSVLRNTAHTRALALDISADAVALTRENAVALGVSDRVETLVADVLTYRPQAAFCAVLANPPYVTEEAFASAQPELRYEPAAAFLGGGADGADFYRAIVRGFRGALLPDGFFAFEIGFDQAAPLRDIAAAEDLSIEIFRDLGGRDRLAVLREK